MRLTPLHPDFGVEVSDFDLQAGGSAAQIAALRDAFDRHQMLLFRGGGRISPERQVEIAGWFGPPGPVAVDRDGNTVSALDNAEPAGSLRLPFHSDLTYTAEPIRAICLHAVALPGTSTSTTFVSGMAAWDRLPAVRQAELRGLVARHFYETRMPGFDWPPFIAEHPVCFHHPRTGRPILFVTEHHADRIAGMDDDAGAALLAGLFDHLYAPAARYEHVWQPDDLLVWDNLALQHARERPADPDGGPRVLQRVALADTPFHAWLDRARDATIA